MCTNEETVAQIAGKLSNGISIAQSEEIPLNKFTCIEEIMAIAVYTFMMMMKRNQQKHKRYSEDKGLHKHKYNVCRINVIYSE